MPALSLAVAGTGELLWSGARGKADIELDVAASSEHLLRLGSVSKVLTSTAAARLASRGQLDLEAPITNWLPGLPEQHRRTTVMQLLTHRGGIRHYIARDFDRSAPGGPILTRSFKSNDEILALFIEDPLLAEPGTSMSYTSFGFTLASLVMEAAAGQPFTDLIKSEIGAPFGLPSLVEDDPLIVVPGRAKGYVAAGEMAFMPRELAASLAPKMRDGWANALQNNPSFCWAGAGFLMSMPDTARFGAALIESPSAGISAAERALLFTPYVAPVDGKPALGLAWRLDTDAKGRRRWHHAGATPGGRTGLVVYPDLGLSVAIATNVMSLPGDVLTPCSDLVDLFG